MWIEKLPGRGRAAILWCLGFFLLAQLALTLTIERWRPDWGDPEYGYRLRNLRRRMKETPDRPLLVVLGSSRTALGFKADCLPPPSWQGHVTPLVYNMSFNGGSITYELLILNRLLAAGVHPRWIVLEIHPVCLNWEDRGLAKPDFVPPYRLRWADLTILDRYAPEHSKYRYRKFLASSLTSWNMNRYWLLTRYLPSWLEPKTGVQAKAGRDYLSPYGWHHWPLASVTPEQRQQGGEMVRASYAICLKNFRVAPEADRLLHEILDTCQRENITVLALLKTPEGSDIRCMYSPETNKIIDGYLTALCREYDTKLIDASAWMSDSDTFDGHHMLPGGAEKFTLRLWNEVLASRLEAECTP
jgi:hypothetical protein